MCIQDHYTPYSTLCHVIPGKDLSRDLLKAEYYHISNQFLLQPDVVASELKAEPAVAGHPDNQSTSRKRAPGEGFSSNCKVSESDYLRKGTRNKIRVQIGTLRIAPIASLI